MLRKLMISTLALLTLSVATVGFGAKTASAEVIENVWLPAVTSMDNSCEPGTVPISLAGVQHRVSYTTPEGTLKMNIQAHLAGTDADGTEYVANMQRHMEHPAWPGSLLPFTDTFTTNLISKGSTVNARITMVYDMYPAKPVVTVTACRG